MRHDFADGKYTVIHEPGKLTALRNGEPWQDLVGNNLVYWMLVEVDRLKEELAKVTAPVAPAEPMKLADEFELRRLLAEERETTRQLVRALAEATQGTTFMGEPVLPAAPVAPAALLDLLDKRRSDSYSCGVLCDDIKATLAAPVVPAEPECPAFKFAMSDNPSFFAPEVQQMLRPAAPVAPAESIGVQEAWEAAGGNPGMKASKSDLLDALGMLDKVCDEADTAPVSPASVGWPDFVRRTNEEYARYHPSDLAGGLTDCTPLAAAPKFIHCLDAWAAWHLRTRGKFVDPTRIPTGELRESFLAFRRGALDERRIGLPTGPVRGSAYSAGLAWRLRACPPIIEPDDWRRWYEDAMCASNEAGFVGMTAAQTIHALVRELEDAKRGSS